MHDLRARSVQLPRTSPFAYKLALRALFAAAPLAQHLLGRGGTTQRSTNANPYEIPITNVWILIFSKIHKFSGFAIRVILS
jgi:hypothetical protein